MIYKCKKCKRFLVKIENDKNINAKKIKNIEILEDSIKITCKCGEVLEIKKRG